jgi:hypothetical protein
MIQTHPTVREITFGLEDALAQTKSCMLLSFFHEELARNSLRSGMTRSRWHRTPAT